MTKDEAFQGADAYAERFRFSSLARVWTGFFADGI
jgi:hypothetical protein